MDFSWTYDDITSIVVESGGYWGVRKGADEISQVGGEISVGIAMVVELIAPLPRFVV